MTDMRIHHDTFYTEVTVRESDRYSKQVYLKLESVGENIGINNNVEYFMTPTQLKALAHFFLKEATEIEKAQTK
jgi:hypothetical protein